MTGVYWPYVGYVVMVALALNLAYVAFQRRWTWTSLLLGISAVPVALGHSVAPFRGFLDPEYVGYRGGFLAADRGAEVLILTGTILIAAWASAFAAISNRSGRHMSLVAVFFGFAFFNYFLSELPEIVADPGGFEIRLGEYQTIPAIVTIPLVLALTLPWAYGVRWAWRRAAEGDPIMAVEQDS